MNDLSELKPALRKALEFLTDEDAARLAAAGQLADVADGKPLIEEGSCRRRLLILLSGRGRVVRSHLGNSITVSTVTAPTVLGEVAYLDQKGASASVFSDGAARVLALEDAPLGSLLDSVPGLSARLHQSLSSVLAARLRLLTDRVPSFLPAEVPQVKRPKTAARAEDAEFTEIADAINSFRQKMLKAQAGLRKTKGDLTAIGVQVVSACEDIKNALTRFVVANPAAAEAVGPHIFREVFSLMMSSALIERCYTKPRGYAGDFETIEMIYAARPQGTGSFGRMVDEWALGLGCCEGVRYRRTKIVGDIKALLTKTRGTEQLAVASLAVGPGREMFDIFEDQPSAPIRMVGIDIDDAALSFCAEQARKKSLGDDKIRLFQDNLIKLSLGRGQVEIPKQHFIYSMGFIDYIENGLVLRLINWAYDQLLPGGTLALGNFATGSIDKPYMDYVVEWILIHRTPDELRELFARSKFGKTPEVRIDTDPTGIQLFAYCTKP